MKEYVTDNNRWLSSANNRPVRDDGSVVREGDEDAIENPNYGLTTEIEHPDDVPSQTLGRDITWDQFLDVGMATNATKTNAILLNMPVVAEFGRKYIQTAGIQFADASDPTARLARLMAAAKGAGLIDDAFLATFMQKWVELFPLMVRAQP